MKRFPILAIIATFVYISMAHTPIRYEVKNTSDADRADIPVVIQLDNGYSDIASACVSLGNQEIPCQLDDLDQDGDYDELCFLANLKAQTSAVYTIEFSTDGEPRQYPARVYAEMLVRNDKVKEKNKHNNFIECYRDWSPAVASSGNVHYP